ncbi:MAG: single-stranded DNA-binding protein [Candidatus Kerfeldbacteria bacterium]|nr:single-stranded DNA-binding protein [Candidatus Kerfeldbacteria bacterium]
MDLNKVMIIGRLTRDPEVRTTSGGQTVASFSVATSFRWNDPQGQKQERTEFHNVVAWRRLAEIVQQYLKKGSQVYIEGRLQTRSWDGQDGVKRYRTEIVCDNMIMLGRPGGQTGQTAGAAPSATTSEEHGQPAPASPLASSQPATPPADEEINIEDIPF